jgi:hypothetical protein
MTSAPKPATRTAIPKRTADEVLFRNQNVCCVCQKSSVQIHHIDHNPSNHSLSNLCILCIEHHAQASQKTTMTRNLTVSLLQKYKTDWEASVATRRHLHQSSSRPLSGEETMSAEFELRKTIYLLPTLKRKHEIDDALEYLYNWHLFEGYTEYIIDRLSAVLWLFDGLHIELVSKRLYQLFWQFVDPARIPMSKDDEVNLLEAIDMFLYLASQATLINMYRKNIFLAICENLLGLFQIARLYENNRICTRVRRTFKGIRKELMDDYRRRESGARSEIATVRQIIDQAIDKLDK